MTIQIIDGEGISILSDEPINISSKEEIDIISQEKSVNVLGKEYVLIEQSENKIEIKDYITISGAQVKIE